MPKLRIMVLACLVPFLGIGCAMMSEPPSETPSEKYDRLTDEIRRNKADTFQQHETRGSVAGEQSSGMAESLDLNEGSPDPGGRVVAPQGTDRGSNGAVSPPRSLGLSPVFRDDGEAGSELALKGATSLEPKARLREEANTPAGNALLVLSTVPVSGDVGEEVTLNISVSGVERLYSAPFYLFYNPSVLELIKVTQGEFLKQDGQQTAFFHANHPELGRVMIGLSRLGQVGGVTGSGMLLAITFRAKAPGVGTFAVQQAEFRNTAMEIIPVQVASAEMRVE